MAKGTCANCGKEVEVYAVINYKTGQGACCQECWEKIKDKK